MKVLSVSRPWAALLLLSHGKNIENRTWTTNYRGELAIAAAKSWDPQALPYAQWIELTEGIDLGISGWSHRPADHPIGIIGVVDLHNVCQATVADEPPICSCSRWAEYGQHHWQCRNPRKLDRPVPWRGTLGIRDLPAAVEAAVRVHLDARTVLKQALTSGDGTR